MKDKSFEITQLRGGVEKKKRIEIFNQEKREKMPIKSEVKKETLETKIQRTIRDN